MLDIERRTNSTAVIRRTDDPENDLTADVGVFRLWDEGTGEPTNLYVVLHNYDKGEEVTIDASDEAGMDNLVQAIYDYRPSLEWEHYTFGVPRTFRCDLWVSSVIITKYNAYLDYMEGK
jgi:hypothetical protein